MKLSDVIATWLQEQRLNYEVHCPMGDIWIIRRKGKLWNATGHPIAHIFNKHLMLWSEEVPYGIRIDAYQSDIFDELAKHIEIHEAIYKIWEKEERIHVRLTAWSKWFERIRKAAARIFLGR